MTSNTFSVEVCSPNCRFTRDPEISMGGEGNCPCWRTLNNMDIADPRQTEVVEMLLACDLRDDHAEYMPEDMLRAHFEAQLEHPLDPESNLGKYVYGIDIFSPEWVPDEGNPEEVSEMTKMGLAEDAEAQARMTLIPMALVAVLLVVAGIIAAVAS